MKLLPIGAGIWRVLMVVDDGGACPVLDQLLTLAAGNRQEKSLASRMRRRLKDEVPNREAGPNFRNNEMSRFLRDDIYEFKRDQNRGPGLRVLWFYGEPKDVICTTAFLKRDKTPAVEIDKAITLRKQYFDDIANAKIEIIE